VKFFGVVVGGGVGKVLEGVGEVEGGDFGGATPAGVNIFLFFLVTVVRSEVVSS